MSTYQSVMLILISEDGHGCHYKGIFTASRMMQDHKDVVSPPLIPLKSIQQIFLDPLKHYEMLLKSTHLHSV